MVDETITAANTINDRPVVVEFIIRTDAMVWPMVAFGASNDEITIARDMAPDVENRSKIIDTVALRRAKAVDASLESLTIEATG